jgi:hypothetical protein
MRYLLAVVLLGISGATFAHNGDVIFVSPDRAWRAVRIATSGGREDKITVRDAHDHELSSKDHSSSTGWNGRYLYDADWTPDSRFFVYSTGSSGGHSDWHWQTFAYDSHTKRFYSLDDVLGPIVEPAIVVSEPHRFHSKRLNPQGGAEAPPVYIDVDVDLAEVLAKK